MLQDENSCEDTKEPFEFDVSYIELSQMLILPVNESVVFKDLSNSVQIEVPREYFLINSTTDLETACVGWLGGALTPNFKDTQMLPESPTMERTNRLASGLYSQIVDFSIMTERFLTLPTKEAPPMCAKDIIITWEHQSRVSKLGSTQFA